MYTIGNCFRLSVRFFLPTVFILFVSACNFDTDKYSKNIFRYNESKGIASLDPAFAKNQTVIWPVTQLFNGLVQLNDSLHIEPCIAKRWTISSDGLIYTFYLRNDSYFHHSPVFAGGIGRKVTALDVEYSFARICNPKTASPGLWIFNFVDKDKIGTRYGFRALNDSVFQINLKSPFPAFLGILSMPYCSVVPHEAIEQYGSDFRSNPVGTGPFCFKRWIEGEKLVLVKNPRYFETDSTGNPLPYLDGIAITFIADKQSEFLEFMKGNLDFISGITPGFKDEIITRNGLLNPKYADRFQMNTHPYLNTEYLGFLCDTSSQLVKNSPLRDVRVRKAINMGFDRKKMVLYLRNNLGYPATSGFIPKGMPSFSDSTVRGYSYNPQYAKQLLKEAGYTENNPMPPITLMTNGDYLDISEFIQHELVKIGINLQIEISTGATFREMVSNSKLLFFRGSWIADFADAENYLSLFYSTNFSPSGPNYFHFSSSAFDSLYNRTLLLQTATDRYDLYQKMDQIIIDQAVTVPLFYDMVIRFTNKRVQNMPSNALNLLLLKNTFIKN